MRISLSDYHPDTCMNNELWSYADHFSEDEQWGDPNKIRVHLVYWLDAIRKFVGLPLFLHCGYEQSGHASNSWHYKGCAVDFHVDGIKPLDFMFAALMFPFNGIGFYPYWNNPGFHLDMRNLSDDGRRDVWYRDKKGTYHNINHTNACVIINMI